MDRELINKSNEILQRDKLDIEEQEILNEISIGKLSSTVFLGRLKVLTRKIKNDSIKKTLMNLGYMIYTVSLQSKSLKNHWNMFDFDQSTETHITKVFSSMCRSSFQNKHL